MTYKEFIESIPMDRILIYKESHHITPRCLGGTDKEENLIDLTLREHFIAHKLLHEENPDDRSLFYAYWRMCNSRYDCTPEEYEIART